MAIAARAAGTWSAGITSDAAITIPGGAQSGDRMYLLAVWKDFSITATVAGWTEITEFADGSTATGNGTGSVKVGAWYKDHSGSESNPTLDFSSTTNLVGAAVIVVFSKDAGETWDTPEFVTAAITNWTNSAQTVSSSSTVANVANSLVIGLAGIRDDSATFTRSALDGIAVTSSGSATYGGDYVEYPATHANYTTGNDGAADAGYRFVTSVPGGTPATLHMTATLSAAETGAALWIVQTVTAGGGGGATSFPNGRRVGRGIRPLLTR